MPVLKDASFTPTRSSIIREPSDDEEKELWMKQWTEARRRRTQTQMGTAHVPAPSRPVLPSFKRGAESERTIEESEKKRQKTDEPWCRSRSVSPSRESNPHRLLFSRLTEVI